MIEQGEISSNSSSPGSTLSSPSKSTVTPHADSFSRGSCTSCSKEEKTVQQKS